MSKYVPPQKRIKPTTVEDILGYPCLNRCREWMQEDEIICKHHAFFYMNDTMEIAKYYSSSQLHNSSNDTLNEPDDDEFLKWLRVKRLPQENRFISAVFKKKNVDTKSERYHSQTKAIGDLFERFLRYAVDIDLGLNYVEKAKGIENFQFLDIGFAPGGMSYLLLKLDNCRGVGINLNVEKGGNVYPDNFNHMDRYNVVIGDIIDIARQNLDAGIDFNTPQFNLCIIGITTSGSQQKKEAQDELELKNMLYFSQFLVSLKSLKENGSLLVRMHLGLRLVDLHLMTVLAKCFKSLKSYKPMTEFAMRKTYWVYCEGYSRDQGIIDRLETLVRSPKNPYEIDYDLLEVSKLSISQEKLSQKDTLRKAQLLNPILITEPVNEILKQYGQTIKAAQVDMWRQQRIILEQMMLGKFDRVCFNCRKRSICNKCRRNVPAEIIQGVERVNEAIKQLKEQVAPQ
ncbi:hypothetical protein HK103_003055 [Boothiomyces macroporosus]|uniref:Ribosomal RNA methyltransferase FtsJ domain-containing protein n=1 Tax=Boothiomyces macroporosus TaxID=261099 RepID=A0AAD5U8Z4_9FUNG|nr:hypothetical protein HK103_003055 [Boothiomyces macroporosus]